MHTAYFEASLKHPRVWYKGVLASALTYEKSGENLTENTLRQVLNKIKITS